MSKGTLQTWEAIVIVFVASACTLIIELIAGRLLAPYIGVNLYTWTSVIGVVLAGISLGNYLGGWLADRFASTRLLSALFFVSALATVSILPLLVWMVGFGSSLRDWEFMYRVLAYVAVIFFTPGFVLGTITPVVIRLTLTDISRSGRTIGLIYAFSTLGSILGTFATGFYLISTFGTRSIVFGVAGVLALVGIAVGAIGAARNRTAARPVEAAAVVLGLVGLLALFGAAGAYWNGTLVVTALDPRNLAQLFFTGAVVLLVLSAVSTASIATTYGPAALYVVAPLIVGTAFVYTAVGDYRTLPFLMETDYYTINVVERTFSDGRRGKALVLDRLIHSFSDPADPTKLEYGYERAYEEITSFVAERKPTFKTAFIGGGGYTYPRYIATVYPKSEVTVVEIDPAVTDVARTYLGVGWDDRIASVHEDARLFFNRFTDGSQPGGQYDIVFGDAFNDVAVPYHLTTTEFDLLVNKSLAPDGIYVINIIDSLDKGQFLKAYMRSLKQAFPHVYLVGLGDVFESPRASTFIVVGAKQPLDIDAIRRKAEANGAVSGTFLEAAKLAAALDEQPRLVLTDDMVPVDQLLAWLFEERGF